MRRPTCRPARWWAPVLLLLALPVPAAAQEIGEVTRVREGLGTLERRTSRLAEKDPVRVGLTVSLPKRESLIDLLLTDPGTIVDRQSRAPAFGSWHCEGIAELSIDRAEREGGTGGLLMELALIRGSTWLALLPGHLHTLWLKTPQLRASPHGTYFRTLVDPLAGTFLAADEGEVLVELPGGESFLVEAGDWILVSPAGSVQRGPIEPRTDGLDDPPLLDCCDFRTGPPDDLFP